MNLDVFTLTSFCKNPLKTGHVFFRAGFYQQEHSVMTCAMQIFNAVSDRRLEAKTNG